MHGVRDRHTTKHDVVSGALNSKAKKKKSNRHTRIKHAEVDVSLNLKTSELRSTYALL